MTEVELIANGITSEDNTINVEMSHDEIWFLKSFIKKYHPKKIVEVGVSAGGNTVNLLKWKDEDAQLFSIDVAVQWYQDNTKLSGFMAEELDVKDNWKLYRGYDYLDIYEEIGDGIDFIIIDTVHAMPGEFLSFLAALPQLKDGCVVILHDIHLNVFNLASNKFRKFNIDSYCTGLLYGGVSSNQKWSLKTESISNIGAFVVDDYTRENIKDIFRILCSAWSYFPHDLDLDKYSKYINENYSDDCYALFNTCIKLQAKYFNFLSNHTAQAARVDIINFKNKNNAIEVLEASNLSNINFPNWFKTGGGEGLVIQTKAKSFDLKLKCINDGLLKVILRGPYVCDKFGNVIPSYVNFKTLNVNNDDVIKDNIIVWHNAPHTFERIVEDGEIISVHFEWTRY